jgi:hypothetical protein
VVKRALVIVFTAFALCLLALVAGGLFWSGASLVGDTRALARVQVQPLGGKVVSAEAFDAEGRRIPLQLYGGALVPGRLMRAGERITIDVVVRRPGWLAWATGRQRRIRLGVETPVAQVTDRWPSVSPGAPLRIHFAQPVASVRYRLSRRPLNVVAANGQQSIDLHLGARQQTGSVLVAAAARTWELPGTPVAVTWFPRANTPVVVTQPTTRSTLSPAQPIRLTFSEPVADLFGSARPVLTPSLRGRWTEPDSHSFLFVPTGLGAGLGSTVRVRLPRSVAQVTASGAGTAARALAWTVPPGSPLRLQQLLAEQGYLPVDWIPASAGVAHTLRAELTAAVEPPAGRFAWRYPSTPTELKHLWSLGEANQITRGAVMMFEQEHGLTADAIAGPQVWRALLADSVSGKHHNGGYSYVFVHRDVPQRLSLWHDGQVVLTSPGNTGVPAAPTQLGTWPVFEHLPVGTMSGTNPDGSHYHDPGIRWISYFHGGDALHSFPRATFGTPQSLGCVELPLAAAAKAWPYTPIGTLVTIEN